jgi:hypothetical protein
VIAALVVGFASVVAPAQAESTVSQTTPIAMATENPCTGEPVTLTGSAHYTIQYSETVGENTVKFHSVKTTKLRLSGTAMWSGARYQNEQHLMEEENGTFSLDPFSGGLAPYESTTTTTVPTVGRTTVDVICR